MLTYLVTNSKRKQEATQASALAWMRNSDAKHEPVKRNRGEERRKAKDDPLDSFGKNWRKKNRTLIYTSNLNIIARTNDKTPGVPLHRASKQKNVSPWFTAIVVIVIVQYHDHHQPGTCVIT